MSTTRPHFILFSESLSASEHKAVASRRDHDQTVGIWHFVLRAADGSGRLDAADEEPFTSAERLELLAVVRGLEALEQPSQVTLITDSSSIQHGIRYGLEAWRDNHWRWERFGEMAPVKHRDLWQRVDRAMQYHEVDCRANRGGTPLDDLSHPLPKALIASPQATTDTAVSFVVDKALQQKTKRRTADSGPLTRAWLFLATVGRRLFGWCGLCRINEALVIAGS